MNDDVRRVIYGTIVVFGVGLLIWFGFLYVNACGFTFTCNQGQPLIVRTPIPTVGHAPIPGFVSKDNSSKCQVPAVDLLGAWVTAGASETESFAFEDANGNACQGTYAEDVRPLFAEANIWYPGSTSCTSCHNADLAKTSAAKLDLTSYAGIVAGSQRESPEAKGTDILGGGNWESSLLYEFTYEHPAVRTGHGDVASGGPLIYAGAGGAAPAVTVTPTP